MDKFCVNSIRMLAADMVDHANSGHLGAPWGCAPLANALWGSIMKFSPRKRWMNRDRFVLSAGHASALQYVMLHLTGHGLGGPYDVSMDELKKFRQAGSSMPGHPEFRLTCGVEVTTGPLGQGFANAVGMAIAEAHLAARFNRPGFPLFDYNVYVLAGDGCLMEGVASEAASLAGHLQLHKLIVFYDHNETTIDGKTHLSFSEDVGARFAAYGWNIVRIDGDDHNASVYENAVMKAKSQTEKPTLVIMKTIIGRGAGPGIEGTAKAHGGKFPNARLEEIREEWFSPAALRKSGDEIDAKIAELVQSELEICGTSMKDDKRLPKFYVPQSVMKKFRRMGASGDRQADEWDDMLHRYYKECRVTEPEIVTDLKDRMDGKYVADDWQPKVNEYLRKEQQSIYSNLRKLYNSLEPEVDLSLDGSPGTETRKIKYKAGRVYVAEVLKSFVQTNPAVIGGSPDVASSCGAHFPDIQGHFLPPSFAAKLEHASYAGRYIHFGVREHACLAVLNGISSSSCLIPYSSLFTVFYQYGLPAIRMASISKFPVLYIGTHDSIDVGEDGPTHQPVEVLPQLRAMPNLLVIRPADVEEVVGSFQIFADQYNSPHLIQQYVDPKPLVRRPIFLMTCRGELGLPYQRNTYVRGQDGVRKGAYVVHDCVDEEPKALITPPGSRRGSGAPQQLLPEKSRVLPDIVLIGSGQDVALAMKTKEILLQWSQELKERLSVTFKGFPQASLGPISSMSPALLKVRIVSMPCWELFDEQDQEYQESVLLSNYKDILRIYIEKAATKNTGHAKYAHFSVLMPSYGLSGKAVDVEQTLEFTPEFVAAKVWASWMDRGRNLNQAGDEADRGFSTWVSHLSRRPGSH
jgi:transketolase